MRLSLTHTQHTCPGSVQVPLPACPAGAARAMPIKSWQRQQHGTGTGASSTAAYWIPGPPQVAEPPRKRQRAAGRLSTPAAGATAATSPASQDGGEAAGTGRAGALSCTPQAFRPSPSSADREGVSAAVRFGSGGSWGAPSFRGRGRGSWGSHGSREGDLDDEGDLEEPVS